MSKLSISRKVTIHASAEKVHKILSHFDHWKHWSPWLIAEPQAKVNVSEDGKFYSWEGKRVGSGEMQVLEETENHIKYDLVFLKPWKSKANTAFYLKTEGNATQVEWTMDSNWPFFLFFMKKKMAAYIGMDYERGLKMLKDYAENGKVMSKLEFIDNREFHGCDYLGLTHNNKIEDLEKSTEKAFTTLYKWAESHEIEIAGEPFSQYHKWDVIRKEVNFTAAIPINQEVADIPKGSKKGSLPRMKLHTVRHHGSYDHLGNAWSTIMMQQRNKEFKAIKKIHPLEFYKNDPEDTAPKDLITDVCFAVK